MKYDVIVIGAGLGGLTTAATLAKKGKSVLVLERHFIPGGSATVFERKGVRCEVGLHEMDFGRKGRDAKHDVFKFLGLDKTLPMIQLPQTWRLKTEKSEYTVPHGIKNTIQYLKTQFPTEKSGVDKYFRSLNITTYPIRHLPMDLNPIDFFFYPITSLPIVLWNFFTQPITGNKLDKFFKGNRIKNLLNVNIAYYDDNPYTFTWFYHAAAQYSYYNSAVYIKGGSQVLSDQLVDIIKANGGDVRLMADVKKVETQGNKVTGVTYQNRKTKEMITEECKTVVANCAPQNLFKDMVAPEYNEPSIEKLEIAPSLYTIYVIFKENFSKKFNNEAYSTFLLDENTLDDKQNAIDKNMHVGDRPFVFVDYSTIDAGLVPEGDNRSFGVFTGVSYLDEWSTDPVEYKAQKEEMVKRVFAQFEKYFPGAIENIEFYEGSTPKTIKHYLCTPGGTAYGFAQRKFGMGRIHNKSSKLKNLYFAGAWTDPGGGFTGALISGYLTAHNILCPMWLRMLMGTLMCTVCGTAISLLIVYLLGH